MYVRMQSLTAPNEKNLHSKANGMHMFVERTAAKHENGKSGAANIMRLRCGLRPTGRVSTGLLQYVKQEFENDATEEGSTGDSENPGVDDAPGDAPAHGREAASGADADDGAGNSVGGADGNAEDGVGDNRQAASGFRGEATEGNKLGDALSHGLDDAPSASHGAAAHSQVAAD